MRAMDHRVTEACVAGVQQLQSFWSHCPGLWVGASDIRTGVVNYAIEHP